MNFKVIKYFLLSRFTKPFILGTLIFLFFIIITYSALANSIFEPRIFNGLKINFAEFVTFFVIFSGFSSTVQKADYDFLFTSPLKKGEISLLYMIASILLGGGYFIVLGIMFLFIYSMPLSLLTLLSFSIFGIAVSSLSLVKEKIYLIVFTAIWVWFPFFGIQFSPTSILFGKPYLGIISSLVYSILVIYRSLSDPQIQVSSQKGEIAKSIIKYSNSKNFLIKHFILTYEFAWGYGNSLSGRKLFYYVLYFPKVIAISVLFAIVYYSIFKLVDFTFYDIVAPSVVILAFLMSMGIYAISQERPWIVFVSLDRGSYLSKRILFKSLQNSLIALPFALSDIVLGYPSLGITLFFGSLMGYSLTSYLSSKLNPIQFRGEVYNYRAGSGMLLIIFSEYMVMGVSVISALSLTSSLVFTVISIIITILVVRKKNWETISYELIEKGFV
ncbi:hypothetical protein [Sulfurisphaera ohwakuensis]|uniref:hypothetical protein n=1 Tax=Sulfurisphaera ohwakuensis TaxID=69656 RepID=UPI0036F1E1D1